MVEENVELKIKSNNECLKYLHNNTNLKFRLDTVFEVMALK